MTTNELIAKLREFDPGGEMEVLAMDHRDYLCIISPIMVTAYRGRDAFFSEKEFKCLSDDGKALLTKLEVIAL